MVKGLVLAGGGAKGSYQVGVYEALQELGWQPGVIAGTSVGCLNGAMFALDRPDLAKSMWLTIGDEQIMKKPQELGSKELHEFLQSVVKKGCMDVTPLEETVRRVMDEKALRESPVGYGLVTVNKRTLRPLQLTLEEIPEGKLVDYMLASAACFPAFSPHSIDGEDFIDGGYSDNMPYKLAARMGADELIAVDVDGIGIVRPNLTGLPTTYIRSQWPLGSILEFDPKVAKRNIALGYQDCYRVFGRMLGTIYAIRLDSQKELHEGFLAPYVRLMKRAIGKNPPLALTEKAALLPLEGLFPTEQERALAPLERACQLAEVDPARIYTAGELFEAFLSRYDGQQAQRFLPLYKEENGFGVREAALAVAAPGDFLQATVWAALTGLGMED